MHDDASIPAELLDIAERLGFPGLETRSDCRDFREVAVWQVRDALTRAYEAGRRAAPPEPPPPPTRCHCPVCGREIQIRPLT